MNSSYSIRHRPTYGFPWENRDNELRKKGLELSKENEKLLITKECTYKSEKYFFALYIPKFSYILSFLKIIFLYLSVFIFTLLVLFFFRGINYLSIFFSLLFTFIFLSFIIKKFSRFLAPKLWEKISGFAVFDSNKNIISDENKIRDLFPAARLSLKLYFVPVVVQEKIPEIYDRFLNKFEKMSVKGQKKLKNRKLPQSDLEKELRNLNLELYNSDFRILKKRREIELLKTRIHNLELGISEDFKLNITEYKEILIIFKNRIEKFKEDLKNRLNTYEKYLIKINEKYQINLRPSKFGLLKYSALGLFLYSISRSFEPFIVLSGEAAKYIFDYFTGLKKLKRSVDNLNKIEKIINQELEELNEPQHNKVDFRHHSES